MNIRAIRCAHPKRSQNYFPSLLEMGFRERLREQQSGYHTLVGKQRVVSVNLIRLKNVPYLAAAL
jgi:hypothetical protein